MAHRGIAKLLKSFHLRPVKSMKFIFDPYSPNVRSIRLVRMCATRFSFTTLRDYGPMFLELLMSRASVHTRACYARWTVIFSLQTVWPSSKNKFSRERGVTTGSICLDFIVFIMCRANVQR